MMLVTKTSALRRCWHAVAFDRELDAAPIARTLLGVDLVLWRTPDGSVHAAADRCPHRWARLSAGAVDASGLLTCPYHGWRFASDGRAALIPQLAVGAAIPPTACVATHRVTSHLGMLWVCLDGEPVNELPIVPEFEDPAYRGIEIGTFANECSAAAIIDNNTDGTHVAFVHAGTFGAGQDPRIAVSDAVRTAFGIRIESPGMPIANRPDDDASSSRRGHTEMWLPFVQVSRMRYPDGSTHLLLKACCPVDDARTIVHLTVLRDDVDQPADTDAIVRYESAIEAEDAAVLRTLPAEFPLDVTSQCHIRHDRPGIEYRRALADLIDRAHRAR
jgi:phenylpropionate dioxygenase-like ring-hydroxylating dioxygenase large terminal subunit